MHNNTKKIKKYEKLSDIVYCENTCFIWFLRTKTTVEKEKKISPILLSISL